MFLIKPFQIRNTIKNFQRTYFTKTNTVTINVTPTTILNTPVVANNAAVSKQTSPDTESYLLYELWIAFPTHNQSQAKINETQKTNVIILSKPTSFEKLAKNGIIGMIGKFIFPPP
jgi:hypothetical protein